MSQTRTVGGKWRLGAVSYLNAKPLVEGLDRAADVELTYDVPARLPELLNLGQVDVALTPVVDLFGFQRSWETVSDACIGCDGQTLTVRIFSRVEPERITRLHVDGDSHTSVALARAIWQERYGRRLAIVPFESGQCDDCQAVLLIGDKVVTHGPEGFAHQIDLGGAWQTLTGLPFVFAVWAKRQDVRAANLADLLNEARDRGVAAAADIAARHGPALGWPVDLAVSYLTEHLQFTLTPRHRQGMELFFDLAHKWGILPPAPELTSA